MAHIRELAPDVGAQLERLLQVRSDEIDDLGRRLEERTRQLEQFAHLASHDLKAPLRRITLYSSRLEEQMGDALPAGAKESMAAIERAVLRMRSLIDDLLDYSRAGMQPLQPDEVDAAECARAVVEDLGPVVLERGAVIEIADLPRVHADPNHLRQVFQNLIANAISYHGTEPPRVRLTGERRNGVARFLVTDNGPGIEPEHHERIFEVFTRLHVGDASDGNGVGLALCRRIVERHGGRIWVESTPGAGATFCFELRADGPAGTNGASAPAR